MDFENLHRRLKKIIGQVQAIDRMVDEDVPCEDVLSQIREMKKHDRKNRIIVTIKNFFRTVWNLTKAAILVLTVLYFINAIFF